MCLAISNLHFVCCAAVPESEAEQAGMTEASARGPPQPAVSWTSTRVVADTGPDRAETSGEHPQKGNFVPSEKILVRRRSLIHLKTTRCVALLPLSTEYCVVSCCTFEKRYILYIHMHTYIYTNTHTRMRYFIYIRINQVRHYTYYIH